LKCFFADVRIQLIGEDTHNSIGESAKSHGPEEENNTGFEEKAADISTDNDPVKADVVDLILAENCCKKAFTAFSRNHVYS
jgi:hypothetical protein